MRASGSSKKDTHVRESPYYFVGGRGRCGPDHEVEEMSGEDRTGSCRGSFCLLSPSGQVVPGCCRALLVARNFLLLDLH